MLAVQIRRNQRGVGWDNVQKPPRIPNDDPVSNPRLGFSKTTISLLQKTSVPTQNVATSDFIMGSELIGCRANLIDSENRHHSGEEKARQGLGSR